MNGKYKIFEDFSNGILFTYDNFNRIGERIEELKN